MAGMKETRYAILVGMNGYKTNPLSYSVKDVVDLKAVLISNCRFQPEKVFVVQDSSTPVLEQIEITFSKIHAEFRNGEDLFLFYYSGHGEYDDKEENSLLLFEDETTIAVGDVFQNFFVPLKAKNQYLIVDACHSGNNVHIKEKGNIQKRERKLLYDSKELFFLFAAEANRKAYQGDKLQNSYYTFYLIEAIKNKKNYDEDGFLSMASIDEYVRRKISKHTDIVQIPGSESRTTGYKPFAFHSIKEATKPIPVQLKNKPVMTENKEDFDLGQSLSSDNREKIQSQLKTILENSVNDFSMDDLKDNYDITVKPGDSSIPYEIQSELEKSIIIKADKENISAVNETFVRKLVNNNRKRTGLSAMFDMVHGEQEPEYSYDIRYNEYFITSAFIHLKAKSFQNVSGGIYCLFYQSKYGFVFGRAFFRFVWDGSAEKMANFTQVELTPYRLIESNVEIAKNELLSSLKLLTEKISTWNSDRQKEINEFMLKAK
jgi:hypothetical protein